MGHKKCAHPVGVCAPNCAWGGGGWSCTARTGSPAHTVCSARSYTHVLPNNSSGPRPPALCPIADGCAGVPAVRVATVVAREGVALVLAARTQGAQEGTPDRFASMHLVASCMACCQLDTVHHTRARCTVGMPHVVCRRFVVAVGYNVWRDCRRTGSLQQRSAVWPGDASVPRDGSCTAPLIARAARSAAVV